MSKSEANDSAIICSGRGAGIIHALPATLLAQLLLDLVRARLPCLGAHGRALHTCASARRVAHASQSDFRRRT
jgi:hypothetical protein